MAMSYSVIIAGPLRGNRGFPPLVGPVVVRRQSRDGGRRPGHVCTMIPMACRDLFSRFWLPLWLDVRVHIRLIKPMGSYPWATEGNR